MSKKKGIIFPILDNLTPTIESCTMKMIEELGEFLRIISKGKGLSGEKRWDKTENNLALEMISEAFDVAQSAVTMIHTISNQYGINVDVQRNRHEMKLKERGYLVEVGTVEKELQNEANCLQCLYSIMSGEELAKLGSDPCDACLDLCNWEPKEEEKC